MRLFGQCGQVPVSFFPSFVTLLPSSEETVARTILLSLSYLSAALGASLVFTYFY
jgi:membrane protease YdiL (CAAX protease family)